MSARIHAIPRGTSRQCRRLIAALGIVVAGVATATPAAAQSGSLELRPMVGAFIATGSEHRNLVKDATLIGAQASWAFNRAFAVTGNFGWVPTTSRDVLTFDDRLEVYQYDVGAEGRMPGLWKGLGGFAGLGVGGRTYRIRGLPTQSDFDGYFALGGDYAFGRTGVRLEGRDYISRFRPLLGGASTTSNDVTIAAGLTFRL